jgi:FixJ family two-component response regulator
MHSTPSTLTSPRQSPVPSTTPTVFIVDDDVSVRESLECLVKWAGWQPETFSCAQAFLECPRILAPSCLVLDVGLPDLNGLQLQERLATEQVQVPIVFITGNGDIPTTVKAMKAGAVEFLTKPIDDAMLLAAISDAVARSSAALGQQTELALLQQRHDDLTPREREVMALVVSGLLNKQVGGELGISEITVKRHRGRVMAKMKARSLPDLVNMAATLGLPPPRRRKTAA